VGEGVGLRRTEAGKQLNCFAGKTGGRGDLAIKKEIGRDDNTC